jgi:hypothetical protein
MQTGRDLSAGSALLRSAKCYAEVEDKTLDEVVDQAGAGRGPGLVRQEGRPVAGCHGLLGARGVPHGA